MSSSKPASFRLGVRMAWWMGGKRREKWKKTDRGEVRGQEDKGERCESIFWPQKSHQNSQHLFHSTCTELPGGLGCWNQLCLFLDFLLVKLKCNKRRGTQGKANVRRPMNGKGESQSSLININLAFIYLPSIHSISHFKKTQHFALIFTAIL